MTTPAQFPMRSWFPDAQSHLAALRAHFVYNETQLRRLKRLARKCDEKPAWIGAEGVDVIYVEVKLPISPSDKNIAYANLVGSAGHRNKRITRACRYESQGSWWCYCELGELGAP